ncbi:DUF1643 domain-containing protein [Paenibacillus spongiae]|uniref:DUF1643 domain-containing protein n=1 Tax=Paenibacillus spongiae TaxID=2909671 RepID=A0ABY5SDR8_9BACL|nr:DUF1643 domain-containing protein [Paenibacillus spongiae]UVI32106.1 DUF1643 domain-containing protein [Paenibacillus spongiae]
MDTLAIMSDNNEYRYRLTKIWDANKGTLAIIMLNPSKANVLKFDDTVMKIFNYAIDNDYGQLDIVNLFAYMSTDPTNLKYSDQRYESLNDIYIKLVASQAEKLLIAWGPDKTKYVTRKRHVETLLIPYKSKLICFQDEKGVSPRHPLFLSDKWTLMNYNLMFAT